MRVPIVDVLIASGDDKLRTIRRGTARTHLKGDCDMNGLLKNVLWALLLIVLFPVMVLYYLCKGK